MLCRDDAATASELVVRIRRLERIVEQIGGVLVPQIMKVDVDGFQQNSVGEQIGAVPVPQIWEPIGEGVQLAPDCGCPFVSDHGCPRGCCACHTTGARAEPYARADYGLPCLWDHGGLRGSCACSVTGVRSQSYSGAARG